jgi:hypothetical protein
LYNESRSERNIFKCKMIIHEKNDYRPSIGDPELTALRNEGGEKLTNLYLKLCEDKPKLNEPKDGETLFFDDGFEITTSSKPDNIEDNPSNLEEEITTSSQSEYTEDALSNSEDEITTSSQLEEIKDEPSNPEEEMKLMKTLMPKYSGNRNGFFNSSQQTSILGKRDESLDKLTDDNTSKKFKKQNTEDINKNTISTIEKLGANKDWKTLETFAKHMQDEQYTEAAEIIKDTMNEPEPSNLSNT